MLRRRLGMGLALLGLAVGLQAKVHYVNQGVRYHIGDGKFDKSEDSNFLDTYPAVGQEWIQAFKVNEADTVKVHIDHIWGVDDCPYCKVLVSIGSHDMGRLTAENNHTPFDTLQPLAMRVEPGQTYLLKVTSYGTVQVDDFVIEGISVETEHADVTFLAPGPILRMPDQPMPKFVPPAGPRPPCEGAVKAEGWLPAQFQARGLATLQAGDPRGDAFNTGKSLASGEFMALYVKSAPALQSGPVGQAFEILLGAEETGWVFSFAPGASRPRHGNLKIAGRYQAPAFKADGWMDGGMNELRVARCSDGLCRIWLNGRELSQSFRLENPGPAPLRLKSLGMDVQVSEKP